MNVLFIFKHLLSDIYDVVDYARFKCKYIELYHSLAKLYFNKSAACSRKYCAIITARGGVDCGLLMVAFWRHNANAKC